MLFAKKKKTQKYYVVNWKNITTFEDMKEVLSTYTWRLNDHPASTELFNKGFLIEKEREV
jgi:uncharacterized FlgJ-related protein